MKDVRDRREDDDREPNGDDRKGTCPSHQFGLPWLTTPVDLSPAHDDLDTAE